MKNILTSLKITLLISVLVICANAATITVTNTNDSGAGSLRQAILDAAPGSTIDFDPTVFATPQTITLTSGQLVIDKNLAIQGPGASILSVSGNNASRVFSISSGVTATLGGMTITDGSDAGGYNGGYGGGISNVGTLTVTECIISENSAGSFAYFGDGLGGGIFNDGTLAVSNSTILGNSTAGDNGYDGHSLGGGIYNSGSLIVVESIISGNGVGGLGDGILGGGGIYNSGTATVLNSTISENTVGFGDSNLGGGIYNDLGTLTISDSTIFSNTAEGGPFTLVEGGGIAANAPIDTLRNTIVAGNTGGDIYGIIVTASHNLIGDAASAGGIQNGVNGNIVGVNPMLGPLQDNGGPTMTHALLAGSPAINTGDNCVLSANGCGDNDPALTADQTGYPRDGSVDIGAFEFGLTTAATVKVSGRVMTNSGRSIRKAVVTMTDAATGATRTVKAKPSGAYSFNGITAGQSYVFQATAPGYKFEPQFLTVQGDVSNLNFIGQ